MASLSDERALLKALLAARLTLAADGIASYAIAGRQFTKRSLSELTREISDCESRIAIMQTGGVAYSDMSGPDSAEPIGSFANV